MSDENDYCPFAANPNQADFDGDGTGDECDSDTDDDGIPDESDPCDFTPPETMIDATGRPLGDLDCDCDVDLVDYGLLGMNLTGPTSP